MSAANNEAWRVVVHEDERSYTAYTVGIEGVTRICKSRRGGEYCDIPYIEVWAGGVLMAECSQHKCQMVLWEKPAANPADDLPF